MGYAGHLKNVSRGTALLLFSLSMPAWGAAVYMFDGQPTHSISQLEVTRGGASNRIWRTLASMRVRPGGIPLQEGDMLDVSGAVEFTNDTGLDNPGCSVQLILSNRPDFENVGGDRNGQAAGFLRPFGGNVHRTHMHHMPMFPGYKGTVRPNGHGMEYVAVYGSCYSTNATGLEWIGIDASITVEVIRP